MARDLAVALRTWIRRPGPAATIVATLAIGIGATVALVALIHAVLLAPFPFADQEELMTVWLRDMARDQPFIEVSYPDYLDWRAADNRFASMAAMPAVDFGLALTGRGEPRPIKARPVSASFFEVLGTPPALGRTFREEDDRPGAERVAIIGDALWASLFARETAAIGESLIIDGDPYSVVGVMPPDFEYPAGSDLWLPIEAVAPQSALEDRRIGWLLVVGRVAEGKPRLEAQAALDETVRGLDRQHWSRDDRRSVVTPLVDQIVGGVRRPLAALGAAVVLVLLIGCANVTSLLLARTADGRRELAVRVALGASARRLARQAVLEVLPLALVAAALGALLSTWILAAVKAAPGLGLPRAGEARLDLGTAAIAAVLALVVTGLCALGPALGARRLARRSPAERLRSHTGDGGSGRSWIRDGLVVAETALAVVVVAGALLVARSTIALLDADLGFDAPRVLTLDASLSQPKYYDIAETWRFFERAIERVGALPGVESAAAVFLRPLWGPVGFDGLYIAEGQSETDALRNPHVNVEAVTAGYFETMGIRRVAGRDIANADDERAPGVVVVSESMARHVWPDARGAVDVIGKRLRLPIDLSAPLDRQWFTVVGVVADVRYREIEAARLDVYLPYRHFPAPLRHLVVRASGSGAGAAAALAPAVRAALLEVDPAQPIDDVRTMEAIVGDAVATRRFTARLFSALAVLALGLAGLGVYGVMAYRVAAQRREIGVRMALGARRGQVTRTVLNRSLRLAGTGALIGLAGAFVVARALASMLYEVKPTDPSSFIGAAAALLLLALAGAYLPARRAGRVDPSIVLRQE